MAPRRRNAAARGGGRTSRALAGRRPTPTGGEGSRDGAAPLPTLNGARDGDGMGTGWGRSRRCAGATGQPVQLGLALSLCPAPLGMALSFCPTPLGMTASLCPTPLEATLSLCPSLLCAILSFCPETLGTVPSLCPTLLGMALSLCPAPPGTLLSLCPTPLGRAPPRPSLAGGGPARSRPSLRPPSSCYPASQM